MVINSGVMDAAPPNSLSATLHRPATVRRPGTWRSQLAVDAHRKAVTTSLTQIARELEQTIGKQLTMIGARIKDPKALSKYASGQQNPRPEAERRLRDLYLVVQIMLAQEAAETVYAWLIGSDPLLGDESPIELLHDGETLNVARAAESFVLGG